MIALPEEQRLEAIERLFEILEAAPAHEAMLLSAILVSKILSSHRIQPGSDRWREFFTVWLDGVAMEMAIHRQSAQRQLHCSFRWKPRCRAVRKNRVARSEG
jgi:hypothetical protein